MDGGIGWHLIEPNVLWRNLEIFAMDLLKKKSKVGKCKWISKKQRQWLAWDHEYQCSVIKQEWGIFVNNFGAHAFGSVSDTWAITDPFVLLFFDVFQCSISLTAELKSSLSKWRLTPFQLLESWKTSNLKIPKAICSRFVRSNV